MRSDKVASLRHNSGEFTVKDRWYLYTCENKMSKKRKPVKRAATTKISVPDKLYHVTSPDCVNAILAEGLKGNTTPRNRGEKVKPSIYLLIDPQDALTFHVALNQIWVFKDIESYAVLEIDREGITGKVLADEIAEASSGWHRVVEQDVIEPRFIRQYKVRQISFPGAKVFELMQVRLMSEEPWSDEDWAIARQWIDPEAIRMRRERESHNQRKRHK